MTNALAAHYDTPEHRMTNASALAYLRHLAAATRISLATIATMRTEAGGVLESGCALCQQSVHSNVSARQEEPTAKNQKV